jgi:hypothetical protein
MADSTSGSDPVSTAYLDHISKGLKNAEADFWLNRIRREARTGEPWTPKGSVSRTEEAWKSTRETIAARRVSGKPRVSQMTHEEMWKLLGYKKVVGESAGSGNEGKIGRYEIDGGLCEALVSCDIASTRHMFSLAGAAGGKLPVEMIAALDEYLSSKQK